MKLDLVDRLDAELREPIETMLQQMPPMSLHDLPAARAASRQRMSAMRMRLQAVPGVATQDRMIPATEASPGVPVRIYRPERKPGLLPCLLWIHGGGYMLGDIEQEDLTARQLALAGGCVVVSVEYRLAPESPFPAPLEDCYAALKWIREHVQSLKTDLSRIALGGASAGGGLAAGLALLARDRGEVNSIFQLLVYPMIDDCNVAPAGGNLHDTLLWTRESNKVGWRSYLGCEPGSEGIPCYAAAFRSTDMRGLPPAYIAVGDLDLFCQEDIEYARRLVDAGVPTELHVYPGGCHAFDMLVPRAEISRRFTADIHRSLKRAFQA